MQHREGWVQHAACSIPPSPSPLHESEGWGAEGCRSAVHHLHTIAHGLPADKAQQRQRIWRRYGQAAADLEMLSPSSPCRLWHGHATPSLLRLLRLDACSPHATRTASGRPVQSSRLEDGKRQARAVLTPLPSRPISAAPRQPSRLGLGLPIAAARSTPPGPCPSLSTRMLN